MLLTVVIDDDLFPCVRSTDSTGPRSPEVLSEGLIVAHVGGEHEASDAAREVGAGEAVRPGHEVCETMMLMMLLMIMMVLTTAHLHRLCTS